MSLFDFDVRLATIVRIVVDLLTSRSSTKERVSSKDKRRKLFFVPVECLKTPIRRKKNLIWTLVDRNYCARHFWAS